MGQTFPEIFISFSEMSVVEVKPEFGLFESVLGNQYLLCNYHMQSAMLGDGQNVEYKTWFLASGYL